MYGSVPGSEIEPFVQLRGHFRCRRANLQLTVSNQRGYFCPCRDPRCSFQCHRAHGHKQAAILAEFLTRLSPQHTVFKGCLKFVAGTTRNTMNAVQGRFSRLLNDSAKRLRITLKFRSFAHDTGTHSRHFDYLGFSDTTFGRASETFKNAARVAGLAYVSTKEIAERSQIRWAARYMFKVDERPESEARFVFLPAKDGSRLIWGSQRFFSPETVAGIWKKLRGDWFDAPSETLTRKATNEGLLQPYLPFRPEESVTAEAVHWLLPWPTTVEEVRATLLGMAAIRQEGGRFWLDVDDATSHVREVKLPYTTRLFRGRVPYHADHFPLPQSVEDIGYEWEA